MLRAPSERRQARRGTGTAQVAWLPDAQDSCSRDAQKDRRAKGDGRRANEQMFNPGWECSRE
eukprot:358811-Chlamydomonas_euryale.AAC.1